MSQCVLACRLVRCWNALTSLVVGLERGEKWSLHLGGSCACSLVVLRVGFRGFGISCSEAPVVLKMSIPQVDGGNSGESNCLVFFLLYVG